MKSFFDLSEHLKNPSRKVVAMSGDPVEIYHMKYLNGFSVVPRISRKCADSVVEIGRCFDYGRGVVDIFFKLKKK